MDWRTLNENNLKYIPSSSGVYWIRCCNMKIQRLHGTDKNGILMIGETKNLNHRLETFYRAANGKTASHSEGQRYYYFRLADLNRKGIEFRYQETNHRKKRESEELEKYELEYRELPPLNRSGGWLGYNRKGDIKQMSNSL